MAYLQTSASNVSDVLDIIASFASGLGWTVVRNNVIPSDSNRQLLTLSRAGADYAHFFSSTPLPSTSIHTMRSIGVDAVGTWSAQPERSGTSETNLLSPGPYPNLWLFGESGPSPYIHCVVEHTAGRYRHFGIGELIKIGSWTGGSYSYGTSWVQGAVTADAGHSSHAVPFSEQRSTTPNSIGYLRCDDTDAPANVYAGIDNRYVAYNAGSPRRVATGFCGGNMGYVNHGLGLEGFAFSNYNQRAHLLHLQHFVSVAGSFWRPIGEPPAVRACNIAPFTPGEEFTIGSDIWKVFPLVRKGVTSGLESSGNQALAYKKVT